MFAHLETLSVEYYNEHKTGDIMARFINDLNSGRMAIAVPDRSIPKKPPVLL